MTPDIHQERLDMGLGYHADVKFTLVNAEEQPVSLFRRLVKFASHSVSKPVEYAVSVAYKSSDGNTLFTAIKTYRTLVPVRIASAQTVAISHLAKLGAGLLRYDLPAPDNISKADAWLIASTRNAIRRSAQRIVEPN